MFTDHDIDELLADIQQQIMQEIQEELEALERAERQDHQLLSAMADEHMQHLQSAGAADDDAILCPVCRRAHLVQRHGRLVCPAEGWQLNLAAESLQLPDIRHRLATSFQDHASSGCPGQLQFKIENLFGSQSLTSSCTMCQGLTVVL
eukprot:GHUV01018589.1.p1 GENE.GHUV01018589.1~~GHUV01018589.1.p1  ORF type:complete len:148 (+),score=45.38 GHUV01018589.1:749-1192(+)